MTWINFEAFTAVSLICWLAASAFVVIKPKSRTTQVWASVAAIAGTLVLAIFIGLLWLRIDRPPMRTLGETRLWYSLLLPAIGIASFRRWKYNWLLLYSLFMGALFLLINLLKPETHDKSLMPALQSIWFVPHVIVYMFAYALLAASSLAGLKAIYMDYRRKNWSEVPDLADNFVYLGFAFLTMGLLFGALWAKEAWGHYWTWDPKETWAFITWTAYLIYIHYRYQHNDNHKQAMWILVIAFALLLICWFGVNYLPTAQNSVHTYSS
ncbi:cytochrome c biogenesis protein CcsA [Mangrovibacterium lignilyticum]|uniref:cytochrome c biogenesis protein CcsA n=1 Tax=Mangrovibacterium lignilyticum TaxID=2668052 RepID=UPI0013D0F541|nr:cytochrome c biogenesis protein CcsA [Mangrovibacterium lignilyticum]